MPFIKQAGLNVPHSVMKKQQSISEMYAMFQFFGLPCWFFTLAPLSNDDLLCLRICKASFGDPMSEYSIPQTDPTSDNPENNNEFNIKFKVPDYHKRLNAITDDPMASSKMFMRMVRAVFVILLGICCNFDDVKKSEYVDVDVENIRNESVFGKLFAHFGVFETNGRKFLHFHSLLFGIFNPTFMTQIIDDKLISKLVVAILDSFASCEVELDYHTTALFRSKQRLEAPRFPNVPIEASDEIKTFKVMRPYLKISDNNYVPLYPSDKDYSVIDSDIMDCDVEELKTVDIDTFPSVQNNHLCDQNFKCKSCNKTERIYWKECEIRTTNLDYLHGMSVAYNNLHRHCKACTMGELKLCFFVFFCLDI
jgi:hypothetical protein